MTIVSEKLIPQEGAALTRPGNTTAYAVNDAVTDTGGAATALQVCDSNDTPVSLTALRISTADTGPGTATALFEAWLYNTTITPAADNAAFTNSHSGLVGIFSGTFRATTAGSFAVLTPVEGSFRHVLPVSGSKNLRLIFKTLTIFTPSANSTVFNIVPEGIQGRA